jgi:hypothetical protein
MTVGSSSENDQVYEKFRALPMDEIETWALQTAETTKPVQRS